MKREIVNWKISQRNLSREKSQISKRMDNTEERLRHIENAYKKCNIFNCHSRRKSERYNGTEAIFEKLTIKTFLKLMEDVIFTKTRINEASKWKEK